MTLRLSSGRTLLWSLSLAAFLLFAGASHAFAQETPQETAALDAVTRWKIINSLIFAALLGWALWKFAPAFFNARSADIQKAIEDATGLKLEADFRYSEIDRKMATLGEEVKRLREQAKLELDREHDRFRADTQAEIEHIQRNVAAEMDAFRQEAILQIRQRATQLAIELAERRLEERFQSGEPEDMLQEFIHLVEQGKN